MELSKFKSLFSSDDYKKIKDLDNKKVEKVLTEAIEHMSPSSVMVVDDSKKDEEKIAEFSLKKGEEKKLATKGHTIHFDSYFDQARDKDHTSVLLPKGEKLSRKLNYKERDEGLKEIFGFMKDCMKGKTMIVAFYCLGPQDSIFSISTMQITDSFYVCHSENILYRKGYKQMKKLKDKNNFFYFWHSAGQLNENNNTVNIDKRRIYIDPKEERVFSVNNQYAGNSLACKKLSLRLAIHRANNSDWLTEHMFLTGISPPKSKKNNRVTYFTGAYPSACGKTSTAMVPGAKIVGDDIVYIRNINGEMKAVNIEQGVFGIIKDVNAKDDPIIFKTLTEGEREIIFSNVCYDKNLIPQWQGSKKDNVPTEGFNHSGKWKQGKKDKDGNVIPISHGNSRFTVKIENLENANLKKLHDPNGCKVSGILYGGRDPDTNVPCAECLTWEHGVVSGAIIESLKTSATLKSKDDKESKPIPNSSPMANMDFIIVPLGKYITNHMKFGTKLGNKCPTIFTTNYFLTNDKGEFCNTKLDKLVWLAWFEGRVNGEYKNIIKTPIGYLPSYEDLKNLFAEYFEGRDYKKQEYIEQFSIRCDKYLQKYQRMHEIFDNEPKMPDSFKKELNRLEKEITDLKTKHKKSVISPFEL